MIETFEEMLQNITQRYAENERRRVKVTKEQSVQAVRHVTDVSTHADFLEKSPQQEKENQREALLPGRIFQIPEFQLSKLQFRKAIDKLYDKTNNFDVILSVLKDNLRPEQLICL